MSIDSTEAALRIYIFSTHSQMGLWFLFLLPFLPLGESDPTNQINQTDLQVAMSNMRASSYHGYVILLKMLEATPDLPQTSDITFLMPNNERLSEAGLTTDHLKDFILSHSIPSALLLSNLLHFPSGTLVPSGHPNRMISITNNGKSAIVLNNARIVTPNVCSGSVMKCHGINATLDFGNLNTPPSVPTPTAQLMMDPHKKLGEAKSVSSIIRKRG